MQYQHGSVHRITNEWSHTIHVCYTDISSLLSEIKLGYKTYDTIVNIVNHTCLNSVNSRYTFYGHIDHEWILNSWWLVYSLFMLLLLFVFHLIHFTTLLLSLSISVWLICLLLICEYDSNQKWMCILIEFGLNVKCISLLWICQITSISILLIL